VQCFHKGWKRGNFTLLACGLLLLTGCQQKMARQPSYRPLEPSIFFADGRSARPLVPGTVARGQLRTDRALFTGRRAGEGTWPWPADVSPIAAPEKDPSYVNTFPFPVAAEVMNRGQERYNIFCIVCHDPVGTGRGKIVERGYTPPPSFHQPRLRDAPVGYFFEVISNGFGSMPDYAAQIPPRDRWAIVAYIRALQLSQHARLAELPADVRQEWEKRKSPSAGGQTP
jgi:mono/diheme cytochrome c family protein